MAGVRSALGGEATARRSVARFLTLVFFLGLLPLGLEAQVLTGTVLDRNSGEPVPTVFIEMLDAAGHAIAAAMTDSLGLFSSVVQAPGSVTVRLQAMGYRPELVGPMEISGTTTQTFLLTPAPISLPDLLVRGNPRCVLRPETAVETAAIWERVRQAVQSAAFLDENQALRYDIVRFRRRLDADRITIWREERRRSELEEPFRTLPADSLLAGGFVRNQGDTLVHFMPDLAVLLSRSFMDAHCFDLVESREEGDTRELRFEPFSGEGSPYQGSRSALGLRGIFRIDNESGAPLSMEYEYLETGREDILASGLAEFDEVLDHLWIIRAWTISMPRVRERKRLFGLLTDLQVVEIVEDGGRVLDVHTPEGLRLTEDGREVIYGRVSDSIHDGAIEGAVVRLSGMPWTDTTGMDGAFQLQGIPPGRYLLSFSHPLLDTLRVGHPSRTVEVPSEGPVALAVPSRRTALRLTCPELSPTRGLGVLWGTVSVRDTPVTAAQVRLLYSWIGGRSSATAETDETGFFRFCGVPPGTVNLEIRLVTRNVSRTLAIPHEGFVRVDIDLAGTGNPAGVYLQSR